MHAMLMAAVILSVEIIAKPYRPPDKRIAVTYHWQRRSMQCAMGKKHEERTDCAVIQLDNDNRTMEFGAGCHDEFLPSIRNIRNVCPLLCKGADTADLLAKDNHHCAQHFTYGIVKLNNGDFNLWRSGKCLEATVKFDLRCGFPFNPEEFQLPSNDDLLSASEIR